MQHSEQINELVTAMAIAQGEIKGARKDSKNPFFKSDYADLTSIWEAAQEPITKNGMALLQPLMYEGDKIIVITMLAHKSGQWMKSFLPIVMTKHDPQSMGSAITYARRYGLAAMLNICTRDDDGEAAMDLSEKDIAEIKKALDGDQEVVEFFSKRYSTKDLYSINRSQKTEMLQMIKKRNENKKVENGSARMARMA